MQRAAVKSPRGPYMAYGYAIGPWPCQAVQCMAGPAELLALAHDNFREIPIKFKEISGKLPGKIRHMSWKIPRKILEISRKFAGNFPELSRKFL